MAAVLAAGPGALLSHQDAAALHGLRSAVKAPRVHVTTVRRAASTRGLRVHRARELDPRDRAVVDGIPVTSVTRTLVDLAGVLGPRQLTWALDEAERLRLLDVPALHDALTRTRGRRGPAHARLGAALERLSAIGAQPTASDLEDLFLEITERHGLPPPRTNHRLLNYSVDACWLEQRVAVELDSYEYHRTRHKFENDRIRSNRLQARGWVVLRFTHRQLVGEPNRVADTVATVLARQPMGGAPS